MKDIAKLAMKLIARKIVLWILGILGLSGIKVIGIILISIIVIIAVAGASSIEEQEREELQYGMSNLSPHVIQYQPQVEKYAEKEGVSEHVAVILAIMQQESGGNPDVLDPMQSSESLCGRVGCITNPEHSIQQGVKHFKNVINRAKGDLKLAIQSYNFGGGFIDYVKQRDGKYEFNTKLGDKETYDLSIEFSQKQYQKQINLGNGNLYTCLRAESAPLDACYGDILYVWSVMQYVMPQGTGEWLHGVQGHYEITSPFRPPHRPKHNGIDFGCQRKHLPIVAVDDGTVVLSTFGQSGSGFGGYGNVVVIKHSNNLYSLYAHLQDKSVSVGDVVKQGQALGTCGNTGASEGIHLHLEARTNLYGGQFNPITLIEGVGKGKSN